MSIENVLQRLDKVKKTGHNKWQACCPAHEDRGPSLSVRETDDGRVLLHCFAGCGAAEILDGMGLDFSELFPPKIDGQVIPKVRKPWNASDVLSALAFEILVAVQFANKMVRGEPFADTDRERLVICASRLQAGLEVANGY